MENRPALVVERIVEGDGTMHSGHFYEFENPFRRAFLCYLRKNRRESTFGEVYENILALGALICCGASCQALNEAVWIIVPVQSEFGILGLTRHNLCLATVSHRVSRRGKPRTASGQQGCRRVVFRNLEGQQLKGASFLYRLCGGDKRRAINRRG